MPDRLLTRAVRHAPDGRATVRVKGVDVDVTAAPPPLPTGAVMRWDHTGDGIAACPDCGDRGLTYAPEGHVPGCWVCAVCGSEFLELASGE